MAPELPLAIEPLSRRDLTMAIIDGLARTQSSDASSLYQAADGLIELLEEEGISSEQGVEARSARVDVLVEALLLIGTECSTSTAGAGACTRDPGRTRDAQWQAERWCDQCIAWVALKQIGYRRGEDQ